jgi:NAD(P)-dependent dehydrogenase (short-subunit alcohol dehydrogenase family)
VYKDINFSFAADPSSPSVARNGDPEAVFVVTGASRGIGFQFVKSLMDRTKGRIIACCRSPAASSGLQDYISSLTDEAAARLEVMKLDVEDQQSIEAAGAAIKNGHTRVDVLFNVAGILGDGENTPGPERALVKMDREWMEKSFAVNLFGPVMLSKELVPLMVQRRRVAERPNSIVVNLSARVGSISDNGLGGWYSYRMSKSALNQATRTMSHELKRQSAWCIALHPGTTGTCRL